MNVGANTVVSFDYVLCDSDGRELDSSRETGPLAYLHGAGGIIPGLADAMTGRASGERFSVVVQPEQAYGLSDPKMIAALPRERFSGTDTIAVGMQFHAQTTEGHARVVRVVAVDDRTVTIDANHPLAGQSLSFDITVVDVREATASEIEHGHPHGQHCEHHDKGGCGRQHQHGCG